MAFFTSSPTSARALDQAGQTWFNTLRKKYQTLLPSLSAATPTQTVAKAELDKLLALPADKLRQSHLADLEDWLVVLMSGAELRQWVNLVRDDFRNIFGEELWLRTLPTLVPQVDAASDVELLAEARRLQSDLHWHYSLQPWAMEKRQEMMQGILLTLILVVVFAALFWVVSSRKSEANGGVFVALLALMGTLGGSISAIQRVQSADFNNARAVSMARHARFRLGVVLSPLQGAVFALLITLLLTAGVATSGFIVPEVALVGDDSSCPTNAPSGALPPLTNAVTSPNAPSPSNGTNAPKRPVLMGADLTNSAAITQTPVDTSNTTVFMTADTNRAMGAAAPGGVPTPNSSSEPAKQPVSGKASPHDSQYSLPFFGMKLCFGSGKDVALLLLWAFIAGFSERLVPDLLSRLENKGKA